MRKIHLILQREIAAYFGSPLAYIFIVVFVTLSSAFTFYLGNFFAYGQADLQAFFSYHPWLFLLLAPAIAMRLWAEERKSGSIELLMTLPISATQAVLGKFLAAWAFCGVALAATFPLWITVNVLGTPDNGVILASYVASLMVVGAFLSIGGAVSAMTSNQVIAFVVSVTVCFLLMLSSLDIVLDVFRAWAPSQITDAISSVSVLNHFIGVTRGVISLADGIFFLSMIAMWLFITVIAVDQKRGS